MMRSLFVAVVGSALAFATFTPALADNPQQFRPSMGSHAGGPVGGGFNRGGGPNRGGGEFNRGGGHYRGGGFAGGGYRHRGGGYGGAIGAGVAGLAAGALIGGAIANQGYNGGYYNDGGYGYAPTYVEQPPVVEQVEPMDGGESVGYCQQRYKSYDVASGTYLGFDGARHPCP